VTISIIVRDVTPCSLEEINHPSIRICCFDLEELCWRWRWQLPPKHWWISTGWHFVRIQQRVVITVFIELEFVAVFAMNCDVAFCINDGRFKYACANEFSFRATF